MAETIGTVTSKVCAAGKVVVKQMEARTWDKENEISKKDIDELLEKVMSFAKVKDEFLIKMSTWKKTRQGTIDQLNYIANECDSLHKGCNIANVTGSSVGASGGLMALGGLVLAPFTFGTSLSLTVAGGVVGAAGAATNITTSIVESSKMKGQCQTAQDCLDKDKKETEAISTVVEQLLTDLETLDSLQKKLEQIANSEIASIALDSTSLAATSMTSAIGITRSVQALQIIRSFTAAEISVLKECPKMLKNLKAFKGTALAAGKLATVFAVAGLGVSVWEIVTYSKDIHNGSKSEAGNKLRENARNLREQLDTLCQLEDNLKRKSG